MTDTFRAFSTSLYAKIARDNMEALVIVERQIRAMEKRLARSNIADDPLVLKIELEALWEQLAKHASIVIVFSAIAVESYIYDYAARHLSDKFVQAHLDKMDIVSKWLVIPQLVNGKSLPKNGKWLTLLQNLVKERNAIVHGKSKPVPADTQKAILFLEKRIEENAKIPQRARLAIELLDALSVEMRKLDPEEEPWTQIHLN